MARLEAQCSAVGSFCYAKYFKLYIDLIETIDIASNSSSIEYNVYCQSSDDGSIDANHQLYFELGGNVIRSENVHIDVSGPYANIPIASGKMTFLHNSDGSKEIWVGASIKANNYGVSASISGDFTLNTIPRASSISCSTANIEENAVITISSASNSFTHTVIAYFGNETVTVATGKSGGSFQWTIPSSFYAQIPNSKTGVGTIRCHTYNGGTLIGTKDAVLNVSTSETRCKPSISGTVVDTNQTTIALTGNANKLIKYKSTAKATISTSAKNSASISKKVINGTTVSGNELSIANVSTTSFNFETVDSRGYSNSTTVTPSMINYIPLTINANFFRPQPTTGEVQLKYSGNYFNGSFGATSNSLSITWKWKKHSDSSWTTGGTITPTISGNKITEKTISLGTSFDYQTAYDFQIIATDKLTTFTQTANVSVGMPVFYWGKDFFKTTVPITSPGAILANNRHILGYRGEINTNADSFNTAITTGLYRVGNNTSIDIDGAPYTGTIYGILEVKVSDCTTWNKSNNWIWQTFYQTGGAIYQRSATNGGSFSPWQRIYRETSLFDNSSGTAGNVELSESAENFSYIEIISMRNSNYYSSGKIYSPNGKSVALTTSYSDEANMFFYSKRVDIFGSNITIARSALLHTTGNNASINCSADGNYIVKVIGYR